MSIMKSLIKKRYVQDILAIPSLICANTFKINTLIEMSLFAFKEDSISDILTYRMNNYSTLIKPKNIALVSM
jgi:hypothetical protein